MQMGKTPSRNKLEYWNTEEHKWISIADLTKTGKYISETKEYLSDSAVEDSGIKVIPANTVVMSFKLSIGKTAITAEDMYSNEAIMAFHDKHVVDILPEYIYYMFKYKNWDEGSNKAVMGKTLNKAILSEIEIDICSMEEQRKIVEVLDKMMAVLEGRETELSMLDDLIRARFVEMFGDPANNEKGFIKAPMGDYMTLLTDFSSNGSYKTLDSGVTMYDEPNYAWMVTNTKKTELLFLALFLRMLKKGGQCACIVPDGVLFGSSKAHKSIRQELVENHQLRAVISMPSGVFKPYAGVSTAVLVFTKTGAGGTDKVWFYDMEADGFSLDDKRSEISENDIPDIIERFHHLEQEEGRERTEQSFFVPKQEIVENDYDLSINKYKKTEYVAVEYPPTSEIMANIRELEKEISREMDELEKLLQAEK